HARNDQLVSFDILLPVFSGETAVVFDDRSPWAAPGIGAERLALFAHQIENRFETVLLDVGKMLCKPLMAADAILGAANRPEQDHAQHHPRMHHRESGDRSAAHAAAHDVSALDLEMIEQSFPLCHVMRPGDPLDATAGLPALA